MRGGKNKNNFISPAATVTREKRSSICCCWSQMFHTY